MTSKVNAASVLLSEHQDPPIEENKEEEDADGVDNYQSTNSSLQTTSTTTLQFLCRNTKDPKKWFYRGKFIFYFYIQL
jgi:hypothetical protein